MLKTFEFRFLLVSIDEGACNFETFIYRCIDEEGKNFINEGKIGSRVSTDWARLRGREGERRVIGTETNEIGKLSFSVK